MSELKLEEVLETYTEAAPQSNDLKVLQEISEKNSEYANDLADFAAARAVARYAPEEELSEDEEERFGESGIKNLRMILDYGVAETIQDSSLSSLVDAAKSKGLSRSSFAAALGLSVSLVQYLEKRRIEFATIPEKVIERIAETLDMNLEGVKSFLKQTVSAPINASFKVKERPIEQKPKSFAEAVSEDQQLSPEQKRNLLSSAKD